MTVVKNSLKKLRLPVSKLWQFMLRSFIFIFPVHVCQVGWNIIPDLLDKGFGV